MILIVPVRESLKNSGAQVFTGLMFEALVEIVATRDQFCRSVLLAIAKFWPLQLVVSTDIRNQHRFCECLAQAYSQAM